MERGIVSMRVGFVPRSVEIKPSVPKICADSVACDGVSRHPPYYSVVTPPVQQYDGTSVHPPTVWLIAAQPPNALLRAV